MAKFKLAFGIHNHQPVGNFEAVFQEAHQKAYLPFVRLIKEYPELRISLHQSGILWKWQQERHPEYFELIGQLVDRGQLELMTGGFYEPILIAVPERDAVGQIAMLTDYLRRHFETEALGLWLTERIWEPHLPALLNRAGIKYLPVDDTHFVYAGFQRSQLTGPFITESEGHAVTLLPIQKRLRYLIPFGTIDDLIAELRSQAERDPSGLAIYADDVEKFGIWPNTHQHCYKDGWLRRFFDAIEENRDWLEIIPLGEAALEKAVGQAYLPTASYEELLHWALPAEAYVEFEEFEQRLKADESWERFGRFVRGGHWRGFLSKYPESNLMHKKMLRVSDRLQAYLAENPEKHRQAAHARDRLYASQCNCPYWHGVFGGLYLPHIRQAVYSCMIEADHGLRELEKVSGVAAELCDYDADGHDEIVVTNDNLTAVIKPSRGGMLLELSLDRHGFSLTDTMTRRREGYHRKLLEAARNTPKVETASIHDQIVTKEVGLEELLVEDWHLKRCFIDHILPVGLSLDQFLRDRYRDEGDFVLEPFEYSLSRNRRTVRLLRRGEVRKGDNRYPLVISKEFIFDDSDRIIVRYSLENKWDEVLPVRFAVENNFTFQAGHAEDRYVLVDGKLPENAFLDSSETAAGVSSIALVDDYRSLAVNVEVDRQVELWRCPILTVSLSEGGFEKVYQGTTLVHVMELLLPVRKPVRLVFTLQAGTSSEILSAPGIAAADAHG